MVKVGNQGLDDRYIHLRSHRISNPVVSGLRQSHFDHVFETRFWTKFPRLIQSMTKIPFNTVSNQNWFLGNGHACLTCLVLRRAICSRNHRFRLNLCRCYKSKSCCNIDLWVC